ncbi:alpha/beta-hydrolase [Trametes maxima]|nr:alpha/beta-hydrolase [Trametes maxima]
MPTLEERAVISEDGTKIFVESAGHSSKPAIVFVHGLASTGFGWDHQFADPRLLRDFHLVRYDVRGHGRSGKPLGKSAYESIRFAQDFKAACDSYGIEKPFLAGWSAGAAVVVDLVAAYGPSYLSGVLYIGGPVLAFPKYQPACMHPSLGNIAFVDSCTAPGHTIPYAEKLRWMGAYVALPASARAHSIGRPQPVEVWEQRARGLPVLVVQGVEDQHCVPETMIRFVKAVYEDVEVRLLEGTGHSPAVERPAETNMFIHEWVTKIAARALVNQSCCAVLENPPRSACGDVLRNIFLGIYDTPGHGVYKDIALRCTGSQNDNES